MSYKLGKLPARPNAVSFKLTDYLTLPTAPAKFGHEALVQQWQMLGNDQYGDCVWAGAAHETMLWNAEANQNVVITDSEVLGDYAAATGFNPNDPNSDKGTDMQVAASYRRKTGIEGAGSRHKVLAYLSITLGNIGELKSAISLFSAAGIGFKFPSYAMSQFNQGQSWHVQKGGQIVGGHYVPAVGYTHDHLYVVTWGKIQRMTWGFYQKYADEVIVYLSPEMLTNNKSLEGFDLTQLQADLSTLT